MTAGAVTRPPGPEGERIGVMGSLGCRCRVRRARQVLGERRAVCTAPAVKRADLCFGDPRAPLIFPGPAVCPRAAADRSRALSSGSCFEPLLSPPIPLTSLASRMEMRAQFPGRSGAPQLSLCRFTLLGRVPERVPPKVVQAR